jgi:oligosaccharide repeat unit polymerase
VDIESLLALGAGFLGVVILLWVLARLAGSLPIHALVYSAVWAPCLCVSQFALGGTIRPAVATTTILVAAWWAFLVGSIMPLLDGRLGPGESQAIRRTPALAVLYILLALQWSGALYEVLHFEQVGGSFSLSTIVDDLARMRVSGETTEIHLPPLLGSFRWSQVVFVPLALVLRSKKMISRGHLLAIYALAGVSALLHFTRAPIAQLSIVIFISWLVLYRPPRKTVGLAFLATGGALLAVFVAVQFAINQKSMGRETLAQSLCAYFGMSPLAYQDILLGLYPREPGIYSLDWLYFTLNKLGASLSYPGLTRPQVWFPIITNVYTYLDVFTLDGGKTGAILGAWFLGVVCSWVYRQGRELLSVCTLSVYAYLCYSCLMTPINNEFIRANVFITIVVSWLSARIIGRRRSDGRNPRLSSGALVSRTPNRAHR